MHFHSINGQEFFSENCRINTAMYDNYYIKNEQHLIVHEIFKVDIIGM